MTFKPLDPPRQYYIDTIQKPEIDYKAAYELQRITTKKTALIAIRAVEALQKTSSPAVLAIVANDLADTKHYLSQLLLET